MLSKPEMTDLVAEQGAAGFGVYIMVLLYLAQCDDFEGMFTNGQLSAFAAQAKKPRSFVRKIICDYGLFEINKNRFRVATKSEVSLNEIATKPSHSPARINRYTRDKVEIDIEKENKEKADVRVPEGTHSAGRGIRPPLTPPTQEGKYEGNIGPSSYESVDRDGRRHGGHGELVPWWAPPQMDVYQAWSMLQERWVPLSDYDTKAERQCRGLHPPEDFMMKTAWEKLSETEHNRIQDYARRQ